MPPQTMRPYQARGRAQIFDAWREGAQTVLAVLAAGGGKTSIFSGTMADLAAAGRRSLLLVHRRELADQACNRLREFGADFGVIMANHELDRLRPYAPIQVASVQTLIRRECPRADLVVCDEAHLSTARTWATILEQYPRAKILGVTATPWRLSGKPLAATYDRAVVIATPSELRQLGFLCPYVGFSYKAPDLSGVKTTGGDYNEKQSAEAMSQGVIVDSIVEEWLTHARALSTVVFAVTVAHSKQLTAKFKAAGVTAEHLDGQTPIDQRRAILKRVEDGKTQVLCNVGVAVEGLDIPRLKCCVLARPTKSVSRYLQMVGRVRRPWQGVTARIHDHAFTLAHSDGSPNHGLPDQDRDYSLDAAPEKPPSLTRCPECFATYVGRTCPGCQAENEPPPPTERVIKTVAEAEQWAFSSDDSVAVLAPPPEPEPRNPRPVVVQWDRFGKSVEGHPMKRWQEKGTYGLQWHYMLRGERRDYTIPGTANLIPRLDAIFAGIQHSSLCEASAGYACDVPEICAPLVRITYTDDRPLPQGGRSRGFKIEVNR